MKRLWISAVLILALAGLSAAHVLYLRHFTGQLTELLTQAQQMVDEDRWQDAGELTRQAAGIWENSAFYLHTTLRHDDIDAILTSFQEVLALDGQERQPAEYAAANARRITLLDLLLEAELPTLKNLL